MRDPRAERKLRAALAGTLRVLSSESRFDLSPVRLLAGLLGLWLAAAGFATLALIAGVAQTSIAPARGALATPEVTVFAQPVATRDRVAALRDEIAALPGVAAARVVSGEVAVEEALRRAGVTAPSQPGRRPLVPDVIVVRLDAGRSADALDDVVATLRGLAQVDAVVGDLGWFRQWEAMRMHSQRAAHALGALAGLLALGALVAASVLFARTAVHEDRSLLPAGPFARRTGVVGGVLFALAMTAAIPLADALDDRLQAVWTSLAPLVAVEPSRILDSSVKIAGAVAAAAVGGALATLLAGWWARSGDRTHPTGEV